MENSLIRDIINLAHDIYNTYKEPALKWKSIIKFRKWRIKRKLDNLEKGISNTLDNCEYISYEAIVDYFSHIGLSYPPRGNYNHTDMIKSKDLEYEFGASFSFPLDHKDKVYACQALVGYEKGNKGINIIYSCKDKNNVILQFTDESVTTFMVKRNDELEPELHNYDLDKEGDIIRNEFAKTILSDIKVFITDKIEFYKERI